MLLTLLTVLATLLLRFKADSDGAGKFTKGHASLIMETKSVDAVRLSKIRHLPVGSLRLALSDLDQVSKAQQKLALTTGPLAKIIIIVSD